MPSGHLGDCHDEPVADRGRLEIEDHLRLAPRLPDHGEHVPRRAAGGVVVDGRHRSNLLQLSDRIVALAEHGIDLPLRMGDLEDSRLLSRRLPPYQILLCLARVPSRTRYTGPSRRTEGHDTVGLRYQSTGKTYRWPFLIGDRESELMPSAGITVD
ncbi:hypothetical protein ACXN5S_10370 [Pseudoroseicyclus sp. H15]